MTDFISTAEQSAIVDRAANTSDSIIISALAGAAKTSTLDLLSRKVQVPSLYLAFNAKNAKEAQGRLPASVTAKTLNSVGHGVWGNALGRRLQIDRGKMYGLLSAKLEPLKKAQNDELDFGELLRALRLAKSGGYIPPSADTEGLVDEDEFFNSLEYKFNPSEQVLINELLHESILLARKGVCDFDDQLYMPTLFGGAFPQFPLVMVDEAQDLSPLNHRMLKKLARKRLIVVGDQNQSIYGFRGAVTSGMSVLKETFGLDEMRLTTSFRCSRSVVELARERAPQMQYPDWAVEGSVQYPTGWSAADIPDGSVILCRLNAPLMKCAMTLIRLGRGVNLAGSDLGPQLLKALRGLGDENLSRDKVLTAIDVWETERLRKVRSPGPTKDRANCLRVFAELSDSLAGAIKYCEHIFQSRGPIELMTGHKSKGGEWTTVYFLEPQLIPSEWAVRPEAVEQEYNLQYVIRTRAKQDLIHVNLETLRD